MYFRESHISQGYHIKTYLGGVYYIKNSLIFPLEPRANSLVNPEQSGLRKNRGVNDGVRRFGTNLYGE